MDGSDYSHDGLDHARGSRPARRPGGPEAGALASLRGRLAGGTVAPDLARVATCLARSYGDVAASVARRRAALIRRAGDRELAASWRRIAQLLDPPASLSPASLSPARAEAPSAPATAPERP